MRAFYELVGRISSDSGPEDALVLRATSLAVIKATVTFWASAGLASALDVYRIYDTCRGKDEGRSHLLSAGRTKEGQWVTMTNDAGTVIAWELPVHG